MQRYQRITDGTMFLHQEVRGVDARARIDRVGVASRSGGRSWAGTGGKIGRRIGRWYPPLTIPSLNLACPIFCFPEPSLGK
jgi:hypothetical protein